MTLLDYRLQTGLRINRDFTCTRILWTEGSVLEKFRQELQIQTFAVATFSDAGIAVFLDDEGKLVDNWTENINRTMTALWKVQYGESGDDWFDAIVGDVIAVAIEPGPDGETLGLAPQHIDQLVKALNLREVSSHE